MKDQILVPLRSRDQITKIIPIYLLLMGFLALVAIIPGEAEGRLFATHRIAVAEETAPQGQILSDRDLNTAEDSDQDLSAESAQRLGRLGDRYRKRGLYALAEAIVRDLLELREKTLGADDPEIAAYLNNLAWLYAEQGKYAGAEPLYQRALAIMEKASGPDDPEVAVQLNRLAELYRQQGKFAQAKSLYLRAHAILTRNQSPQQPHVGAAFNNNLPAVCGIDGECQEGEARYQRTRAMMK